METTNKKCQSEAEGFTFVWKIDNFSHCTTQKGSSLNSPSFKIGNCLASWNLKLFPRGRTDYLIDCGIHKSYEYASTDHNFLFCVCTIHGDVLQEVATDSIRYNYKSSGYLSVIKFEREILEALPEDTLVIHCHVLTCSGSEIAIEPKHCFGTTYISLQRRSFFWKIDKFSSIKLREEKVFDLSEVIVDGLSLVLNLSLVGRSLEDASVQIYLNFKKAPCKTFSTCVVFLMDENGTAKKYMRDEYWWETGEIVRAFPPFLTRRELITGGLSNDTVLLKGEVTLSGDNEGLEHVAYGMTTKEAAVEAYGSTTRGPDEHFPSALSADMLDLLEGSGPPPDFELRVGGRSFRVHQTVLGARSAVFRAMFDSDMLEQSTKGVELTDLEAETAELLLRFAYADLEPPPGVAWERLASLYSAADKYQILALRKTCARRLVQGLDPAKAPSVLQLADRHRDQHLKEEVIDFIFKRGRPVLESDQWKALLRDDPHLVAGALQKIFCEKVLTKSLEKE